MSKCIVLIFSVYLACAMAKFYKELTNKNLQVMWNTMQKLTFSNVTIIVRKHMDAKCLITI